MFEQLWHRSTSSVCLSLLWLFCTTCLTVFVQTESELGETGPGWFYVLLKVNRNRVAPSRLDKGHPMMFWAMWPCGAPSSAADVVGRDAIEGQKLSVADVLPENPQEVQSSRPSSWKPAPALLLECPLIMSTDMLHESIPCPTVQTPVCLGGWCWTQLYSTKRIRCISVPSHIRGEWRVCVRLHTLWKGPRPLPNWIVGCVQVSRGSYLYDVQNWHYRNMEEKSIIVVFSGPTF